MRGEIWKELLKKEKKKELHGYKSKGGLLLTDTSNLEKKMWTKCKTVEGKLC